MQYVIEIQTYNDDMSGRMQNYSGIIKKIGHDQLHSAVYKVSGRTKSELIGDIQRFL
jgi:hypothetical protein